MLTLNRKELKSKLDSVKAAITNASTLEILKHVLLSSDGDTLTIKASDTTFSITQTMDLGLDAKEEGACLPYAAFSTLIAGLTSEEVTLELEAQRVIVRGGKAKHTFPTLPAEEMPIVKFSTLGETTTWTMSTDAIKSALREVMPAVSKDENRVILTGVFVEFEANQLKFVATDTHRLATSSLPVELPASEGAVKSLILSLNACQELLRLGEGDVELSVNGRQIQIEYGTKLVIASCIDGQYPNFKRVIPEVKNTKVSWVFNPEEVLPSIRRLTVNSKESSNRVVFTATSEGVVASAESSNTSRAEEELDMKVSGIEGEFQIAFNVSYFKDFLGSVPGTKVEMLLSDPLKPALCRTILAGQEGDEEGPSPDYTHVLMPMQIQ